MICSHISLHYCVFALILIFILHFRAKTTTEWNWQDTPQVTTKGYNLDQFNVDIGSILSNSNIKISFTTGSLECYYSSIAWSSFTTGFWMAKVGWRGQKSRDTSYPRADLI